ncbi:MAG: ABC transporter permease [Thermomicrobiales bacterium]|nr:ABC transporter permease [Thermomicrobiales bacterium]
MFLIASVVFLMLRFVPGDPAKIIVGNQRITEENLQNIRVQYRLDKPVLVQYGYWVKDLAQGDLGRSFRQRAEVTTLIFERLNVTAKLVVASFLISMLISIPLGIISALKRNTWIDFVATLISLTGASSPVYFTGIVLILLFSYKLDWLPALGEGSGGWDTVTHLALPSLALGFSLACITTRLTRSAMIEALSQDYIETARSKGLSRRSVVLKHAFRNAMIPIVTVAGLQFGVLVVGTVLIEFTFGIGGFGSLIVQAVQVRDYPVVQGATIFIAAIFILVNLVVDILYAVIDTRIRY